MAKKESRPSRHQNAIAAATQALTDATAALGEALRSASSQAAANAVEAAAAAIEGNAVAAATAAARGVENAATKISTRTERRQATRADLLESAVVVFAERGYEGTSVDDVALHAGYTKGAVYSHFGSKADLFLAIFTEVEAFSGQALDDAGLHRRPDAEAGTSADAEAAAHRHQHAATVDAGAVDPCVVLTHELMVFGLRNPEHRQAAAELLSQTLTRAADAALADQATRGIGLSADPATSALATPTPQERQAAVEAVVAESALLHTVSLLRAVGVPEIDEKAALRILATRGR